MRLVFKINGKNTVIGEVYEHRLPICQRDRCGKRIGIEAIVRTQADGGDRKSVV